MSVALTPLWLDSSSTTSVATPTAAVSFDREVSPRPEATEDGLPPSKVQIHNSDIPKINLPMPRHRGTAENFENTEVEELIAMLRETENLEDQGDILQYLVDTQGLDYNTGEYDSLNFNEATVRSGFINTKVKKSHGGPLLKCCSPASASFVNEFAFLLLYRRFQVTQHPPQSSNSLSESPR